MITSVQNQKIKRVRKLNSQAKYRNKHGAFVMEGTRLLEEALETGHYPEWIFYTPDLDQRGEKLVAQFQSLGVSSEITRKSVFSSMSDTITPQGILGVFPLLSLPTPSDPDFLLIVDKIRDPGNLGTLMRSAAAAGADALIISPGTVDPFSPKVVRSAMGAHFRLPLRSASWQEIRVLAEDMQIILAEVDQGSSLWELNLGIPTAIILGGEAAGAGKEARKLTQQYVHIPMIEGTESLNAAAAGAVILFEVLRQRSSKDN